MKEGSRKVRVRGDVMREADVRVQGARAKECRQPPQAGQARKQTLP